MYSNPADFLFMHVISKAGDKRRLLDSWPQSRESNLIKESAQASFAKPFKSFVKYTAPFQTQLAYLFARALKNTLRNKYNLLAKFICVMANSILVSLLYFQIQKRAEGQGFIQDVSGVLFFVATNSIVIFNHSCAWVDDQHTHHLWY